MVDTFKYDWDGKEWQSFALVLVRQRHGATNVQRVPDADRGDLGLEAFTITDGCLYQCYAPMYSSQMAERTRKIRAKMNMDIGKLLMNAGRVREMLGSLQVVRWILL